MLALGHSSVLVWKKSHAWIYLQKKLTFRFGLQNCIIDMSTMLVYKIDKYGEILPGKFKLVRGKAG